VGNVLHLDPVTAAPGAVAAVAPFGDDALEPHVARGAEHDGPVGVLDVLAQSNAIGAPVRQADEQGAAIIPSLAAQLLAVEPSLARSGGMTNGALVRTLVVL